MKTNPVILAIETATSSCSVALCHQIHTYIRDQVGNNVHSKVLLEMVSEVLAQADISANDIDAVAVGQGPGSFTGLRIGVGVAQGIAYGADVPMVGISSLDALAYQAVGQGRVIAGIDARMGEIYWCEYIKNSDGVERVGELTVSPPNAILSGASTDDSIQLVGNAWAEYEGQFDSTLMQKARIDNTQIYPMADSLLQLAQFAYQRNELISAVDFAPEYVRNDVAKKSIKK